MFKIFRFCVLSNGEATPATSPARAWYAERKCVCLRKRLREVDLRLLATGLVILLRHMKNDFSNGFISLHTLMRLSDFLEGELLMNDALQPPIPQRIEALGGEARNQRRFELDGASAQSVALQANALAQDRSKRE